MPEAGMQQGSLIKSNRKRGPDVWQFRWAERGPQGKRIYCKRVIGTVCQYSDADSARNSVTAEKPTAQEAVIELLFPEKTLKT